MGDLIECFGTDTHFDMLVEHDEDITSEFTGHTHFFYGFWRLDKGFFSHHRISYNYGFIVDRLYHKRTSDTFTLSDSVPIIIIENNCFTAW